MELVTSIKFAKPANWNVSSSAIDTGIDWPIAKEKKSERKMEIILGQSQVHRVFIAHISYPIRWALTLSESFFFSLDSSTSPFTFNLGRCTSGTPDIPHRRRDAQPFPRGRSPFRPFLRRRRVERRNLDQRKNQLRRKFSTVVKNAVNREIPDVWCKTWYYIPYKYVYINMIFFIQMYKKSYMQFSY